MKESPDSNKIDETIKKIIVPDTASFTVPHMFGKNGQGKKRKKGKGNTYVRQMRRVNRGLKMR